MNPHLADDHDHKTETFGTFSIVPRIVAMVFRVSRPRDWTDPAVQERVSRAADAWLVRYADRRRIVLGKVAVGPIGRPPAPPDAYAIAAVAYDVPADDWECFSAFLTEPLRAPELPIIRFPFDLQVEDAGPAPRVN